MFDADVIVIGSGGGGAVAAKELGEAGLKVLVLEAGAWYGNKHWANPNSEHGGDWSSDYKDLDIGIYKKVFNSYENNMNDVVSGVFRFGPADRRRTPWHRIMRQKGTSGRPPVSAARLSITGHSLHGLFPRPLIRYGRSATGS